MINKVQRSRRALLLLGLSSLVVALCIGLLVLWLVTQSSFPIRKTVWPDQVLANVSRLTTDLGRYASPRWSPDGNKVAFIKQFGANSTIFSMNSDGSGVTPIVEGAAIGDIDWSPNGKEVVFDSFKDGISHLNIRKEDNTIVSILEDKNKLHACARWSPDGKYIAFCLADYDRAGRMQNGQLFRLSLKSHEVAQLTHAPIENVGSVEWSPDGAKIVFAANQSGANASQSQPDANGQQLYTINSDGSNLQEIKSLRGFFEPTWSPNGQALIFSFRGLVTETPTLDTGMYLMPLNGSDPVPVLDKFACYSPNWSRIRNEVVFRCEDTTLQGYIFKMDVTSLLK